MGISLRQAIDNSSDLKTLHDIVCDSNLHCGIGSWGGRYIEAISGQEKAKYSGIVSLKDIEKRLFTLIQDHQAHIDRKGYPSGCMAHVSVDRCEVILKKIQQLDQQGDKELARKTCIYRLLTAIRRLFGNCCFSHLAIQKNIQDYTKASVAKRDQAHQKIVTDLTKAPLVVVVDGKEKKDKADAAPDPAALSAAVSGLCQQLSSQRPPAVEEIGAFLVQYQLVTLTKVAAHEWTLKMNLTMIGMLFQGRYDMALKITDGIKCASSLLMERTRKERQAVAHPSAIHLVIQLPEEKDLVNNVWYLFLHLQGSQSFSDHLLQSSGVPLRSLTVDLRSIPEDLQKEVLRFAYDCFKVSKRFTYTPNDAALKKQYEERTKEMRDQPGALKQLMAESPQAHEVASFLQNNSFFSEKEALDSQGVPIAMLTLKLHAIAKEVAGVEGTLIDGMMSLLKERASEDVLSARLRGFRDGRCARVAIIVNSPEALTKENAETILEMIKRLMPRLTEISPHIQQRRIPDIAVMEHLMGVFFDLKMMPDALIKEIVAQVMSLRKQPGLQRLALGPDALTAALAAAEKEEAEQRGKAAALD